VSPAVAPLDRPPLAVDEQFTAAADDHHDLVATEWKWAPMVVPFTAVLTITCERGESKDTSLSTPDSG